MQRFDLVLQANGRTGALYYMMSEPDIETAIKFPWVSLGSDAAASLKLADPNTVGAGHPRSYGNFPRLDRRIRPQKESDHPARCDPKNDIVAGGTVAFGIPRVDQGRLLGGRGHLRLRQNSGRVDL